MATYGSGDDWPRTNDKVQTILLPQIERAMASMHHIDELFQWLSYLLVQYFNVPLLLIWTNRANQYGQLVAQLRTIARQDQTFPEQIIVNDQMQQLAQQLIAKRLSYQPQPLDTLFSHYQTILLKRYGLHYWSACFTSKNALLPARGEIFERDTTPAFLTMMTLIFFRQMPMANIIQPMSFVLEKVMDSALVSGLLLPVSEPVTPFPSLTPVTPFPFSEHIPPVPERRLQLSQLIPTQKQDANLMLSDNPFTQAAAITDKKARRLHAAINGQDSMAALGTATGMSPQEIKVALRFLWDQGRIEVHGPDGQTVDLLQFLNDR